MQYFISISLSIICARAPYALRHMSFSSRNVSVSKSIYPPIGFPSDKAMTTCLILASSFSYRSICSKAFLYSSSMCFLRPQYALILCPSLFPLVLRLFPLIPHFQEPFIRTVAILFALRAGVGQCLNKS